MHIETPPFTILALAPFSPTLKTDSPPIIHADTLSLDAALAELAPSLDIPMDKEIYPAGSMNITIKRMADFRPGNIAKNSQFMKELHEAKDYVQNGGSPSDLNTKFPRVAQLITIPVSAEKNHSSSKLTAIDDILSMVDTGPDSADSHSSGNVEKQIDDISSRILQDVFKNTNFRLMESAWRGAELLARQAPSGTKPTVRLSLVPLQQGDNNFVFDMLEEAMADSPPDIILIDKAITNSPRSMTELERIMDFAETMLAPAFIPISPKFLEIDSWDNLDAAGFIPARLEGAEYGRWKTLKEKSGAGWIVPCAGNVMGRTMLKAESGFDKQGLNEESPLWVSPAWAMGALCAKSIATHGRPTRFSDRRSVQLTGLPMNEDKVPCPLEFTPGTERIKDFKQAGILPLAGVPGRDNVFVTGSVTLDGGPLNFKLFLSQLVNFLIYMSETKRDEIYDIEKDLTEAVSLFIQGSGLPAPEDLKIRVEEINETTALDISLTPPQEIFPGGQKFNFGFHW